MKKKFKKNLTRSLTLALAASVGVGVMCLNVNAVSAEEPSTAAVINPIAKYEFKDATNHGKDSMGNYDLEFARYYVAGGIGEIMNNGTIDTVNGGVTFTGTGSVAPSAENTGYCLTNTEGADVFDEVSAFTLAFEFQNHTGSADWGTLIGWSNGEKYLGLQDMADGDADLNCVGFNCYGTEAGQIWSNAWFQNCGLINENTGTTYQKMLISVQPGGKLSVYVNGQSWLSYDLASDWAINDTIVQFAIGAAYNGNGVAAASGAVRNVQIYDFAMDSTAAVEYQTNGVLTEADVANMKTIKDATVSFEGDATKTILNETMSLEVMLKQMNDAKAVCTLSDDTTVEAELVWTEVYKDGDKYYAKGEIQSSKLGYANLFGKYLTYELEVAAIKSIGEPVFEGDVLKGELKDSMTQEEMLALINGAKVTVTLPDDTTQTVDVTFTKVVGEMGIYATQGDVIVNGAKVGTVKVALDVTVTNEGPMKELLPVAKWTFDDATDKFKDSMGKYNLTVAAKEGGNVGNPCDTGEIQDGKLYLNGDDILTLPDANDIGDNLNNGFTLNFQYQQDGAQVGPWASPVSFGFNDWVASQFCMLHVGDEAILRINAHKITFDENGITNAYWGPVVVNDGTAKMYNVTLSVRPGETFNVYVDGACVFTADCPDGWNLSNSMMKFAIGGDCVWGNGYNFFKGWIDNVTFYNFAMDIDQSNAYWEKGKVVVGSMNGEIVTSISDTPKFEGEMTNNKLADNLTNTQILKRMNPATVDALFENGNSIELPITWKSLELVDGKYYVVGVVDASNLGYATTLTGSVEVRQLVEVEKKDRNVAIDPNIVNGTVTADKTAAKVGETITFTITPAEGYELLEVTVNYNTLNADENGNYTYTVETGDREIEVSATFKEVEKPAAGGCGSSLSVGMLTILAPIAIAAVVFKKKEN